MCYSPEYRLTDWEYSESFLTREEWETLKTQEDLYLKTRKTNKVFNPPTNISAALEDVESLLESPSLRLIGEGPSHPEMMRRALVSGGATGNLTGWRKVSEQRRAYALATWMFVGLFLVRILVEGPLYLAGNVAALGIFKLVLGWPAFALTAFVAYRVIRKARQDTPVESADSLDSEADTPVER